MFEHLERIKKIKEETEKAMEEKAYIFLSSP
jgi:hypothetical protein